MKDKFHDIVDYDFTADMESRLDKVESGEGELEKGPAGLLPGLQPGDEPGGKRSGWHRIKVPDEVSDEVCDVCGRQMVVKSGRFGRFLACPGFPECTFTKPLVIEMPGKCPKCGSRLLKKTSRNGYTYYGCEHNGDKLGRARDFMTWDVPVKENCPECGWTMFKKSGRGFKKPFCIHEGCPAFVPEEKRGLPQKKTEEAKAEDQAAPCPGDRPGGRGGGEGPGKKRTAKKAAGGEEDRRGKSRRPKKPPRPGGQAGGQKTAAKKTKKAPEETPGRAGGDAMREPVTVIGAGLAGCEAAWQLAQAGIPVVLREMKPRKKDPRPPCRPVWGAGVLQLPCARTSWKTPWAFSRRSCGGWAPSFSGVPTSTGWPPGAPWRWTGRPSPRLSPTRSEAIPSSPWRRGRSPPCRRPGRSSWPPAPHRRRPGRGHCPALSGQHSPALLRRGGSLVTFESIDMDSAWFASRYDKGNRRLHQLPHDPGGVPDLLAGTVRGQGGPCPRL